MPVPAEALDPGDKVEYHPIGSEKTPTTSVVVDILTAPKRLQIGSREITVHASPDNPRILILNENTGKIAPYRVEHIEKVLVKRHQDPSSLARLSAETWDPNATGD
ncbi:hypothetical protein BZG36_03174 [Bifiguratus adelaidae]|uniref:Hypervirulence associated protein TUDOR domain-containing protein n=1 Tax=Bifiguratus adelaidae TaxID=1938954 RepID=A0A261XYK2_9FUNG|nr:hypothetical protein BZG36_03174 [Bifiguratus adelaidae]